MFSGRVHRQAGGSCLLTWMFDGRSSLCCLCIEVCSFRLEIPPQLSNMVSNELRDLLGTQSAGRNKEHLVCGLYKMHLLCLTIST